MKKLTVGLLIAILACGAALAAPAFSLSAGAGGVFNALLTEPKDTYVVTTGGPLIGGGGYAFLDATYAELGVDFLFSSPSIHWGDGGYVVESHFGFSVLGKYPIAIGSLTVFPLVGIDYQIFLQYQQKDKDGKDVGDPTKRADVPEDYADRYDAFSIAIGGGVDIPVADKIFVRGEALWNFKLDSKYEKEARDTGFVEFFTSGPRINLGVGCKF
jgi:opacity protein-like surface antigen